MLMDVKGNCKFGPKCANIHILPDGRRVNYNNGKGPMAIGSGHLNIGGRVNPDPYHSQSSALTSSFMHANIGPAAFGQYPPFQGQDEFSSLGMRPQNVDVSVPTIDTTYVSSVGSYGSPRNEDLRDRFGSPAAAKGLSVLDAPLPPSFEREGVSWVARNGPIAASVPSKFGLDSPPQSLSTAKDGRTSDTMRNLYSSAFGDDTRDLFNGVAASPPAPPIDEWFGKRPMHSQRLAKQKLVSASLPKPVMMGEDWESDFPFEEELVPDSLGILTPQERARRGSRHAEEESRPIYSGAGTPVDSIKYGSPSNASPSRFSNFFQRQQREEEEKASRVSAFGHVGSPLRTSTLQFGTSPAQRAISRPVSGDASSVLASPPRQSSMSIISQQLHNQHLSLAGSSSSDVGLHPVTARMSSNPIGSSAGALRRNEMDRQLSNSSIGTGRFTTPIDEEQGDFVFSMEEDEEVKAKRNSGGWAYPIGGRSPHLSALGGSRNGNGMSNGGSAPTGGSEEGSAGDGR